ncbi:MAG: tetratricopeptide repeat protein, partial [Verrucomicrobiaceae bacterium]
MPLLKLLLVLFVCAAGPAGAGPLEGGLVAHDKGDYSTALRLLRPLADHGYAFAQNNLGVIYYNGWGVPQDYAAAVAWYRKAADQDDPDGQHNLGIMYANGQGVTQDYAAAMSWYLKAAEQG